MKRLLLQGIFAGGLSAALCTPLFVHATQSDDKVGIRHVMMKTWDKPQTPLDVGPITVLADHAVAGWTQDGRGGRALLTKRVDGQWHVTACAGDVLKDAKTLAMTGMSASMARQLAQMIASNEGLLSPQRRAMFSTFDGMVRMDSEGMHQSHVQGEKH